ncbi:MAG: N-6 DNA methylase [Candidatus Aenigmatarchaeota archaeon]
MKSFKRTGAVYTPEFVIDSILDYIEYNPYKYQSVLDPACGDGRFIIKIAERIISLNEKKNKTISFLENLHGWDIDKQAIDKAKNAFDELLQKHRLEYNVDKNFVVRDSLMYYSNVLQNTTELYDLVIGNPPYVRAHNIEEKYKKYLRSNFIFCSHGAVDLYLAFIELGLYLLKENGILAYIIPNSWMYSDNSKIFRDYVFSKKLVKAVIDFDDLMIFRGIGTYVSIVLLSKKANDLWYYIKNGKTNALYFEQDKNSLFTKRSNPGKRLNDIANIKVGLCTLADKVFILQNKNGRESYFNEEKYMKLINGYKEEVIIEKDILKPIIKASKYVDDDISAYQLFVIFPYVKVNNKYVLIQENDLKNKYPLCYNYLLSKKDILMKRDKGKIRAEQWYAFGRNQNINDVFGEKIIFSYINKEPKFLISKLEDHAIYAGYFIKYNGDYNKLLRVLNSEKMREYLQNNTRPFSSGWRGYNKNAIKDFIIEFDDY